MYVDKTQKEWDRALHFLAFAYNSSVNPSLKFSPFNLMYGREPIVPIQRLLETNDEEIELTGYARNLRKHLQAIRDIALNNLNKTQTISKERYDARRKEEEFEIGSKVLLFNPARRRGRLKNWSTDGHDLIS